MPLNLILALVGAGALVASYVGVAAVYYDRGWTARDDEVKAATVHVNGGVAVNNAAADAETAVARPSREQAVSEAVAAVPDGPTLPQAEPIVARPGVNLEPSRLICPCSAVPASVIDKLNRIR